MCSQTVYKNHRARIFLLAQFECSEGYVSLKDVYHDHFSTKLSSLKLCQNLPSSSLNTIGVNLLKLFSVLDHKRSVFRRKQENMADNGSKLFRHTHTLSSLPEMDAAIYSTFTKKLTIIGTCLP
jgi:hypothetical protein